MAKIRKVKEKELVGGTSNTEVYPITHTEAVYSRKNQKLSDILDEVYNNVDAIAKMASKMLAELESYHVILTQEEYDTLEVKEDKLYFTYEEE